MVTHNKANNIYEKQPSPAPKSQKNMDSHPKQKNGIARPNGSKNCGNRSAWSGPARCVSGVSVEKLWGKHLGLFGHGRCLD